jgi:hypothetical protein
MESLDKLESALKLRESHEYFSSVINKKWFNQLAA